MEHWNIKLENHPDQKYLRFQVRYSKDLLKLELVGQLRYFTRDEWQDIAIYEIDPKSISTIDDISKHIFNVLDITTEKANEIRKIDEIMRDVKAVVIPYDDNED